MLHRPGLAHHLAAALPDSGAGGRGIVHLQGNVAVATAKVVAVDTVVIGELDRRLFRLRAVADEGERELAVNEASFTVVVPAQQPHAQHLGVEADGTLQVADPKHGVQYAHG